MDRLRAEIEAARKEQAEVKNKHKWAMDTWVKLSKELTSMAPNNPEAKKKEKDCENQSILVKQLQEAQNKVEADLNRLSQNLLFFFEENLLEAVDASASSKKSGYSSASDEAPSKKEKADATSDSKVNAFRKHILGYCHGSHGVSDNAADWKEKLPTLLARVEKKLPDDKVASFRSIINGISDIPSTRKKLILWYVDMFPHDRKPQGYYEAAGLPVPKKKTPGDKKEEEEEEPAPAKAKSSEKKEKKESASSDDKEKKDKKATPKKPATPESSSSSSDSDEEEASEPEEKSVKKMKMSKKEETPAPKKKESSADVSSKKKKDREPEEEEEQEAPKKKHHHHHKSESGEGKSGRKSKA